MHSIKTIVEDRVKILRSEFIATLYPVQDAAEALAYLKEHQLKYADATHNCYAYILGYEAETRYYSDAGEPGGTAGKPILNALLRNELTGVLAVVTRYYGGTKLGVKGLIEAYTLATQNAIGIAELIEYHQLCKYRVIVDYDSLESVKHRLETLGARDFDIAYAERVSFSALVPCQNTDETDEYLSALMASNKLSYTKEE